MTNPIPELHDRLQGAARLKLFLDYDGTLDEFAPTPDHVLPNQAVIDLISRLTEQEHIRLSIVSGRRLSQIQALLPIPGVLLAGTYGVEIQTADGKIVRRADYQVIRPILETVKPEWRRLIDGGQGFFLEDKGWSLALHARHAPEELAEAILEAAATVARAYLDQKTLQIIGGHKFLEIGPRVASKGETVTYLLRHYPWDGAIPIYLGDDDKDEAAFAVIADCGGIPILIAEQPRETYADYRLENPQAAHRWLKTLLR